MSLNPDQETVFNPYEPPEWDENAVAEKDAAFALQNDDHRLLALALRNASIPGIPPEHIQAYREQCGLRYMDGFGDVIRSTEDLKRMKQAREYAMHYNNVITTRCNLSE